MTFGGGKPLATGMDRIWANPRFFAASAIAAMPASAAWQRGSNPFRLLREVAEPAKQLGRRWRQRNVDAAQHRDFRRG